MLIPPWVTPGAKCRISMACECGTAMWCCLGHSHHPYIPPADLSLQHSCFIQTPRLARYRVNNGFHHPNLMILLWRWKSSASWRHPHLKQRWFSCNGLGHMLIRKGDQLELSNTPRGSTETTWLMNNHPKLPPLLSPPAKKEWNHSRVTSFIALMAFSYSSIPLYHQMYQEYPADLQ